MCKLVIVLYGLLSISSMYRGLYMYILVLVWCEIISVFLADCYSVEPKKC